MFACPATLVMLMQPLMWHWVGGGFPALSGVLVMGYVLFMSPHWNHLLGLRNESLFSMVLVAPNVAALAHTAFVLWVERSPWWLAAEVVAMVGHSVYEIYTMATQKDAGAQAPALHCVAAAPAHLRSNAAHIRSPLPLTLNRNRTCMLLIRCMAWQNPSLLNCEGMRGTISGLFREHFTFTVPGFDEDAPRRPLERGVHSCRPEKVPDSAAPEVRAAVSACHPLPHVLHA